MTYLQVVIFIHQCVYIIVEFCRKHGMKMLRCISCATFFEGAVSVDLRLDCCTADESTALFL